MRYWKRQLIVSIALALSMAVFAPAADASRIEELCEIQGARGNHLTGIGIMVGLAGTGDKAADAIRRQERLLERMDVDIARAGDLTSDNIAVVTVDALFPPFAKEGTRIDVRVNSLYDAESLEGGTLLETFLYGADGEVYAVAQGAVSVGGFNADAGGASVRLNHVTVGRIPMGAFIEREIPSTVLDGSKFTLLLKRPHFRNANTIREAIESTMGDGTASTLTPGAITIAIPEAQQNDWVAFVADLLTRVIFSRID